MKETRRTIRMEKLHRRHGKRSAALNMVSLMDIFTILVFFLLVTSQGAETLPTPKRIELPQSTAEKQPKTNIVVTISSTSIQVQGQNIANTKKVMRSNKTLIQPLMSELYKIVEREKAKGIPVKEIVKRGITIMGDREIPYQLLKKIMLSCATAKFTNISLAVVQKTVRS